MADQARSPEPSKPMVMWALTYAQRLGWHVFPLHSIENGKCTCKRPDCDNLNQGKHPRVESGFRAATKDPEQIKKWWSKWPNANIGLACGPSGVLVLDVDPRNDGDNTLCALEKEHGKLPPTPTQLTGGGGQHYLFKRPDVDVLRGTTIPDGIDVKGDGGYIVLAPSTHISGKRYAWDVGAHPGDTRPAEAPQWIVDACKPKSDAVQSEIAPDDGYLGAAFRAAGWAGRDLGSGKIAVQCPWEHEHTSGSRFDGSTVVFAPNAGNNTGWFWCHHSHCQHKRKLRDVIRALPEQARRAARAHLGLPASFQPPPETEPSAPTGQPWEESLRFSGDGMRLTKDPGNAALLLANLPEWRGALRYDEFAGKFRWARPVPLIEGILPPAVGDALQDHHVLYVSQWLARFRGVTFGREAIQSAMEAAGKSHGYNPLQEFLSHLSWDGTARVDSWLPTYIGAEDCEYSRNVGRWWLISCVARAMAPGCQADHVLVLKGPQGARKSSAFVALAGGSEWGLESMPRLKDKDAMQVLRGKWIAVFNELESLNRSAVSEIKDYVSRRVDTFRASYGRYTNDVPRSCVFGATANEQYCLPLDATGNRRWWPVEVGRIDVDALARDRSQLFAEAFALYSAGEPWWPQTVEQNQLLAEVQDASVDSDPWLSVVSDWLEAREGFPFTSTDCLRFCLGITTDRVTRGDQMRLGALLRQLGYVTARPRGERSGRPRVYVKSSRSDDHHVHPYRDEGGRLVTERIKFPST